MEGAPAESSCVLGHGLLCPASPTPAKLRAFQAQGGTWREPPPSPQGSCAPRESTGPLLELSSSLLPEQAAPLLSDGTGIRSLKFLVWQAWVLLPALPLSALETLGMWLGFSDSHFSHLQNGGDPHSTPHRTLKIQTDCVPSLLAINQVLH